MYFHFLNLLHQILHVLIVLMLKHKNIHLIGRRWTGICRVELTVSAECVLHLPHYETFCLCLFEILTSRAAFLHLGV